MISINMLVCDDSLSDLHQYSQAHERFVRVIVFIIFNGDLMSYQRIAAIEVGFCFNSLLLLSPLVVAFSYLRSVYVIIKFAVVVIKVFATTASQWVHPKVVNHHHLT